MSHVTSMVPNTYLHDAVKGGIYVSDLLISRMFDVENHVLIREGSNSTYWAAPFTKSPTAGLSFENHGESTLCTQVLPKPISGTAYTVDPGISPRTLFISDVENFRLNKPVADFSVRRDGNDLIFCIVFTLKTGSNFCVEYNAGTRVYLDMPSPQIVRCHAVKTTPVTGQLWTPVDV